DYRVVLVDFDQSPRPVGGLHHPIAFGPRFHRSPMLAGPNLLLLALTCAEAPPPALSAQGCRRSSRGTHVRFAWTSRQHDLGALIRSRHPKATAASGTTILHRPYAPAASGARFLACAARYQRASRRP